MRLKNLYFKALNLNKMLCQYVLFIINIHKTINNEKMQKSMEILSEYVINHGMTAYTDWVVL